MAVFGGLNSAWQRHDVTTRHGFELQATNYLPPIMSLISDKHFSYAHTLLAGGEDDRHRQTARERDIEEGNALCCSHLWKCCSFPRPGRHRRRQQALLGRFACHCRTWCAWGWTAGNLHLRESLSQWRAALAAWGSHNSYLGNKKDISMLERQKEKDSRTH